MAKAIRVFPRVVDCVGKKRRIYWGLDKMQVNEYLELYGHEATLGVLAATMHRKRNPACNFLIAETDYGATIIQRVDVRTRGVATLVIKPFDVVRDDLLVARVSVEFSQFRPGQWADVPEKYRRRIQQQCVKFNNASPYVKIRTSSSRASGARPGRFMILGKGV